MCFVKGSYISGSVCWGPPSVRGVVEGSRAESLHARDQAQCHLRSSLPSTCQELSPSLHAFPSPSSPMQSDTRRGPWFNQLRNYSQLSGQPAAQRRATRHCLWVCPCHGYRYVAKWKFTSGKLTQYICHCISKVRLLYHMVMTFWIFKTPNKYCKTVQVVGL